MNFKDKRIETKHLYLTGGVCFLLVAILSIANVIVFNSDYTIISQWTPVIMAVFYFCLSAFFFTLLRDIPKSQGTQLNEDEIREYFKDGQ